MSVTQSEKAAHFRALHERLQTDSRIFRDGAYQILPTPLRVGADERFTGRGVTIAFLDSGFYPHADLSEPESRILAYYDLAQELPSLNPDDEVKSWQWHGTQTSVAAAGNGWLSDGVYRGLDRNGSLDANSVPDRLADGRRIGRPVSMAVGTQGRHRKAHALGGGSGSAV